MLPTAEHIRAMAYVKSVDAANCLRKDDFDDDDTKYKMCEKKKESDCAGVWF